MRFDWPSCLLLLVPAAWWLWRRQRHPKPAIEFSSLDLLATDSVSWRTRWAWLPDALRALAVCAAILALAKPQWSILQESEVKEGIAIELLVDISSSMDMNLPSSDTIKPTRLQAVKAVLERFISGDGKDLPGRADDLLGLVTFARYADTLSPQTEAHDALVEIVRNLVIQDRANEDGTAYGDAVTLAAARLHLLDDQAHRGDPGAKVKNRVIVLLTDGENNCGRHLPLEATAQAKQWGIRIYVISLADNSMSGATPTVTSTAPSMAEQILMRMASETGGLYQRADNEDSLQEIYRKIDSLEKSEIRIQKNDVWRDLFPAFTALALALLLAEMTLRSTVLRTIP